jgi:hypothetical protein
MDFFPEPFEQIGDAEIIDLFEESQPFNKKEWIGNNKLYPRDPLQLPAGVRDYCESLRKIPESFVREQFPTHNLSVKSFLEFNLPPTSPGINIIHASHCFSAKNLNTVVLEPITLVTSHRNSFSML